MVTNKVLLEELQALESKAINLSEEQKVLSERLTALNGFIAKIKSEIIK